MTLAAELDDIADRLARLAPSHRDPFRFHEDKSELVGELRRLAGEHSYVAANDNQKSSARGKIVARSGVSL